MPEGSGDGGVVGTEVGTFVGLPDGSGDGAEVGAAVGAQVLAPPGTTPHDVDSHGVSLNMSSWFTSSSTHQPRSWLKAEAPSNIWPMDVTLWIAQAPRFWLKAGALLNIFSMSVTL